MARGSGVIRSDEGWRIEGLRQFQAALRQAGDGFTDRLKAANVEAVELVRGAATARATQPVARKTVREGGLKVTRSVREAAVKLRASGRTPFAFGAEFGAKQYRQFASWRGNQWGGWNGGPGYFLHPAIRDTAPAVMDNYWRSIRDITDAAFPD